MNKSQAKEIANSGITVGQLKATLEAAYTGGAANNKRAVVNKGMSKATVFNIMVKGYQNQNDDTVIEGAHCISARNILREFGEYWDGEIPKKKIRNNDSGDYHHEEPIKIPWIK